MRWLFLAACLLAGQALATPDRMTTSDDRLVAATQTHFYVVRDVEDNLGSHYAALVDQHLVEIGIDSGEATRFWPLRLMAVNHLETEDYLNPGRVSERDGERHDMMAVLSGLGAQPLRPGRWAAEGVVLRDGALYAGDAEALTEFGIRKAGRAQLGLLRDYYPPIETEEDYRAAGRIDFFDLFAEGAWDCAVLPEAVSLFRAGDEVRLVKLRCEDFELSGAWSFHAILPVTD
ncbi:MAG: hypothetical protein RIG84_13910 [Roseovarius sp.]